MNKGFSHNGKTLLSGVDPAGKAEKIADAVTIADRTLYLCPSPLYGYGLERLLARLAGANSARTSTRNSTRSSRVLCIEADPSLYALSKENFSAPLLDNPRLRLTNIREPSALCAFLRREWGPRFFRRVEVVRLSGGWQLFPALYDALAETLRREIALDWGNAITLARLGRLYTRNMLRNLSLIPRCPSLEMGSFGGAPALVLGAGPSLDEALDALNARFGEALRTPETRPFRIVCVDTCLSALVERGIIPDLAVILESQHWNLEDFTGLCGRKIPAAFDLSALPRSGGVLAGGVLLFFTPWTELAIFQRLEAAGLLPVKSPPLGSVGLSAAAIARLLTRGTILVAGLDFSFSLDSYHARSTPGHKKKLRRQNRFTGLLNADASFGRAVFSAVSKTGGRVFSTPALRKYRDLFEREFSGADGGARFFDLAGNGLPLGVKTLSPEEAFDLLSENIEDPTRRHVEPLVRGHGGHGDHKENLKLKTSRLRERSLEIFIKDEQNRLVLLRDMLTGTAAMDSAALVTLIDECDYLWAHFPDYAASDIRPSKADLEAAGPSVISFLKRLRVEIDPFLKLWDLAM